MLLPAIHCTSWTLGKSHSSKNCQEMGDVKESCWLPDIAVCPCYVLVELGTRKALNSTGTCKISAPKIGSQTLFLQQCALVTKFYASWHKKNKYLKGRRFMFTKQSKKVHFVAKKQSICNEYDQEIPTLFMLIITYLKFFRATYPISP